MAFPEETVNIKMYGAFRTFTNAAAYLLDHYLVSPDGRPVRTWHHGPAGEGDCNKHSTPREIDGAAGYLCCVKHPITWLNSMLTYLRGLRLGTQDVRPLATLWSFQSKALIDFSERVETTTLWRYEDAMPSPDLVIVDCADVFGLEALPGAKWPEKRMGRAGDDNRHLMARRKINRVRASKQELQAFRNYLDEEVMDHLGYTA